jgi:hypothetical protein
MAEIKSTLELAMERTKKIAISEQEREEIKRKETIQEVNGLFHRYREGHLPLHEILKKLERMDRKMRTMAEEFLLSQWVDALSLSEEDERLIKGIEALKGREMDEQRAKMNHLLSQYRNEKEKMNEGIRTRYEDDLRKEGIYGSAVIPNIEGSEIWKKESDKLNHSYTMKLEEIKEQLRSLWQIL